MAKKKTQALSVRSKKEIDDFNERYLNAIDVAIDRVKDIKSNSGSTSMMCQELIFWRIAEAESLFCKRLGEIEKLLKTR